MSRGLRGMVASESAEPILVLCRNKRIVSVTLGADVLMIELAGGARLRFKDQAGYCCERRYMSTDDNLSYFAGAAFFTAELRPGGASDEGDYDVHQIQFLDIRTSRGVFTLASHNVHNGYYSGFELAVELSI